MRRYFMVNGPLGGNMGTPPVEPQPPQVSFTTTAESRGGFNNFLKSIPQTTAMTPIPPLGSAPTAPMSNPMGNIDIFNQPPSMGMGMMGMNQPQMQQPMQPPMQQPMNMGVGLMGKPIQNFFDGGGVDDSDFGGFSDYGSVDATSDDGFSEDNDVSDYSTDDSGVYTGGDDSNQDIALPTPRPEILKEAVGRAENQVFGDTEGDALGFFNKSGGLTDAGQKEYDNAIMANLDVLQDERPANTGIQLANVFDDQSILGDSTNNVNPADIVQASFKPGSLNPTFSNNVLDGLDLSASLGQNRNRNVEPEAFDMFGNPMSTLTNQPGVSISNRAMQQMVDNDLADRAFSEGNFSMIGPADEEYPGDAFPGKALTTQNVSPQNTADRIARNNRSINEIRAGIESGNDDIYTDSVPNLYDPPEEDPNYNPNVPSLAYQGYNPNLDEGYNPNVPSTLDVNSPRGFTPLDIDTRPVNQAGFRDTDFVFDPANYNMDAMSTNVVPGIGALTPDEKSKLGGDPSNMVEAGGMGIPAPKEFRDPFPNAGIGAIPTLTSLANKFSAYSRGRVLDSIAQKGYTPVYDGDVIVGAKNKSGQLMEGMDPNAPMDTGNDNNENPLILRPIAKAPEEEKEEEKLPNVIGGGETPAPVSSGSVVVDSPFTSNVGNFIPSSFNTGELNKLIEALTGVASPRAMKQGGVAGYAEGGRVMQALDNLLATG